MVTLCIKLHIFTINKLHISIILVAYLLLISHYKAHINVLFCGLGLLRLLRANMLLMCVEEKGLLLVLAMETGKSSLPGENKKDDRFPTICKFGKFIR